MNTHIRSILVAALAWLGSAAAQAVTLPGPVVNAQWLSQHQQEVNIVDVRSDPASFSTAPVFTTDKGTKSLATLGGHIPGALLLDFGKARVARTIDGREIKAMLPDQATFQALMRGIGVKAGKPTVIVPEGASGADLDMAARVYWSMKVYGDDHLALLLRQAVERRGGGEIGVGQRNDPVAELSLLHPGHNAVDLFLCSNEGELALSVP